MKQLFIGVDGGGTKTIVRVEDADGNVLGRDIGGPANIRLSVEEAWQSINHVLQKISQTTGLAFNARDYQLHVGMGLAGCEIRSAYEHFIQTKHPFKQLTVVSDAYAACLGAHQGENGAIIVIGTGAIGFQIEHPHTARAGGFGFPHDDQGGGAWLGLQAVSHALACFDGRLPEDSLAAAMMAKFNNSIVELINWANEANATMFASLAPVVVEQADQKMLSAVKMMERAALAIEQLDAALKKAQQDGGVILPRVLSGGMAKAIYPYLSKNLQSRCHEAKATPDQGAILIAKQEYSYQQV